MAIHQVCQTRMPGLVVSGDATVALKDFLSRHNARRVFLVTDKGVRGAGLTEAIERAIVDAGCELTVQDQIAPEPSYQQVQQVVDDVRGVDLVVGVGGGSPMDTAKLVSLLAGGGSAVRDLLKDPLAATKCVPSLMIPTTCGTGSEATGNAIVAVPEDKIKVGIVNPEMIPDAVILDPEMIRRLPQSIVAATGVDALAHAVECFTSNKANIFSDAYARYSAKLIFDSIERAYDDADDMEAKRRMLVGAFYGGAAITASGTTAVHALSYPLGGAFHIAHGVSNAILFAPVMAFNADHVVDRLAELCDLIAPEHSQAPEAEKAAYVVGRIADIVKHVKIPASLTAFGVGREHLDFLVDAAFGVRRLLDNNRKVLTKEDIRAIYLRTM